jgi:HEAT repeat protein
MPRSTSITLMPSRTSMTGTLALALATALLLPSPIARHAIAQTISEPAKQQAQPGDAQAQGDSDTPPPQRKAQQSSRQENIDTGWSMLTSALADAKHPDRRIQALAAIGTLGASPRAEKMIADAFKDPDLDVRTAAVLAAGQSKDRNLTTPLRAMLDDKEPQVSFTAATTLWKMNDHSGEDILTAVVDGERRSNATLANGARHTVNKDLHSPSTLAKIGALEGASMLLGPFGFGITAYEYARKNGDSIGSARVLAVEQISQEKTGPIRDELIAALADKDPAIRAASAKALGAYREKDVASSIANLYYDPKLPVRLTAAAAYLHCVGAAPGSPLERPGSGTRSPGMKK